MEKIEKIPVFIDYRDGKTVCICHAGRKRCKKNCIRDEVDRDKFRDWKKTMNRSRFGKEH